MRARSLVAAIAVVFCFGVSSGTAHAGPKQEIAGKIKEAMENYDLMDYDAARKLLTQALAVAKKAKLEKDPVVAKAHLDMGIVAFANQDTDAAKLSFLSAVQIDPKIQIEAAYKSAEMAKLLDQARSEASGGGSGGGDEPVDMTGGGDDCGSVKCLEHKIIDSAKGGASVPIEARVGSDVTASKIAAYYRAEGATEFTEIKLKNNGECSYKGAIPSSAMKGSLVHYYVGAFNEVGKQIAGKGSEGSPNIIEIATGGGGGGGGDNEDPIGGGGGGGGGGVDSGITIGPKRAHLLIAVAGGAGSGYVTGETEGMNTLKNCCLGGPVVMFQPEIGYFISPQLTLGIAARIGIPVGANVEGHATAAPGGLVRVRYAPSQTGQGLRFMGQVGVGVLRNTIKLDNSMPGMDTDVVAQGPVLIGGGLGFVRRVSGNVSFLADLSALAGIAAFQMPGLSPTLNNGFAFDLSLGIQLGL
jgi:Tfp pilus assembly protein PilF